MFRVLEPFVDGSQVELRYALGADTFVERFDYPAGTSLDVDIVRLLAVVAGTSYWKTTADPDVSIDFALTDAEQRLADALYDHGMREFAVRNGRRVPVEVEVHAPQVERAAAARDDGRPVLPMGGGKDSTLVAGVLADLDPLLVSVKPNRFVAQTAATLGLDHVVIDRTIDPLLLQRNREGALNGHVPVTAINSLAVAAMADGPIVMANERTASATTRRLRGCIVNHQWSKSLDAERMIDAALPMPYLSATRPFSELQVAQAFSSVKELHGSFMSCNRAFLLDAVRRTDGWCCDCDKCRFTFLVLAPFVDAAPIFGRDLLADADQIDGFRALLSPDRPWECVGEAAECAEAVALLGDDPRPVVRALRGTTVDEPPVPDDHDTPDWLARRIRALL
jgi:UDP-N-acetyl-alpha-D-muramoyl-L-alanyl-L-glutamate epimerase